MEMRSLFLWLAYFLVIWTVYEVHAHPKSWLTTTKPRPNTTIKPQPKTATKTRFVTSPRPRPKRSVAEEDGTFFPEVTMDIKDGSREFLKETETEVDGEEVIIRFLQEEEEEKEQSTEGPDEYAAQKRVTPRLGAEFQGTLETIEILTETTDFPSDSMSLDFLPQEALDKTLGRDYFESTTYISLGIESEEFQAEDTSLPNELIPSLMDPYDLPTRRRSFNHPLHHDTDVNIRRAENITHDNRQAVLLRRLLNHQKQITPENLNFLKENEEESTNKINSDSDVTSEAQLNWEEYHEYDA